MGSGDRAYRIQKGALVAVEEHEREMLRIERERAEMLADLEARGIGSDAASFIDAQRQVVSSLSEMLLNPPERPEPIPQPPPQPSTTVYMQPARQSGGPSTNYAMYLGIVALAWFFFIRK